MCKPFADWPELLTHADIRECLGYSVPKANKLLNEHPELLTDNCRRNRMISKYVLAEHLHRRPA